MFDRLLPIRAWRRLSAVSRRNNRHAMLVNRQVSHLVVEFGTHALSIADHRSRSVAYSDEERALYVRVTEALRKREASLTQRLRAHERTY